MPGVGAGGVPAPPEGEAAGAVTGAAVGGGAGAEGKGADAGGDGEGAAGAGDTGLAGVLMASKVPAT
jgi:hypothetical protein